MNRRCMFLLILGALTGFSFATSVFTVREGEYGLVFQFGRFVRRIDTPGLHWKRPSPFETKMTISRRILMCDPESKEFLTEDKKNVVVDYFFTYRIEDPLQFTKCLKDRRIADVTLEDQILSALGNTLGRYALSTLISTRPEEIRLDSLRSECLRQGNEGIRETGVRILDMRLKRITFPKENEKSIFARMYSERQRIATKYRAEGMEEARKIKARAKLETERKKADAEKEAERIRSEADATAMGLFSETYEQDPELCDYIRRLKLYRTIMGKDDVLVLSNGFPLQEPDRPDNFAESGNWRQ